MACRRLTGSIPMPLLTTRSGLASRTWVASGSQLTAAPGGYLISATTSRPRSLAIETKPFLLSPAPYDTKSVEPVWLVRMAIFLGGRGRLATASNSWPGTNSLGANPNDHPGYEHGCVLREDVSVPLRHGHRGEDVGGGVGTHEEVDLVLRDELLVERGDLRLIRFVVADDPFDLAAEQPAGLVQPVDELPAGDLVDLTGGCKRPAQG